MRRATARSEQRRSTPPWRESRTIALRHALCRPRHVNGTPSELARGRRSGDATQPARVPLLCSAGTATTLAALKLASRTSELKFHSHNRSHRR
jgi:hypothetical protein